MTRATASRGWTPSTRVTVTVFCAVNAVIATAYMMVRYRQGQGGRWFVLAAVLISALNRGRPGMAAVDVFETEPILQGHALLRLENCICTPHIGYVEQDNYELYFGAAFDNVVNFIKGTPTNIVNPGALQVRR